MQKSVFQVISQRLKKVDFKLSPDYVFKDEKVLFDIDLQTDMNRHAEKPMAEVSLTLSLFKKTNDAPFVCDVIYQGLFTWEKALRLTMLKNTSTVMHRLCCMPTLDHL